MARHRVINVTREEDQTLFLLHQTHRVIFVPAFPTEVNGVKSLVRVAGKELLTIHRHFACAGRLHRHIGVARTRDELVELERVEAALAAPAFEVP